MPWPNFFFPRETLIHAVQDIRHERNDGYQPNRRRSRDRLWCLNGATIRSVRKMLRERTSRSVRMELAPLFSPMNEKVDAPEDALLRAIFQAAASHTAASERIVCPPYKTRHYEIVEIVESESPIKECNSARCVARNSNVVRPHDR